MTVRHQSTTKAHHGLDRKFKPWRKGKSASKHKSSTGKSPNGSGGNGSLKNRLRGQRRLLAKLLKGDNNDKDDGGGSNKEEAIEAVKAKILELEQEIERYERKEREKKICSKYHQVKFIERQKLTRLEKSIQKQLQHLKEQAADKNNSSSNETNEHGEISKKISQLQLQLKAIAMDQLYIAFYPPDMKYMALFANGTERIIDDERGQKRRRGVWNRIREGFLKELGDNEKEEGRKKKEKKGDDGAGEQGGSESDSETKSDSHVGNENNIKLRNTKKWVNLEAAKAALLSLPSDTYPNAPSILPVATAAAAAKSKTKKSKDEVKTESSSKAGISSENPAGNASSTKGDSRFVLSKEKDGMFLESTTGDDFHKELEPKKVENAEEGAGGESGSDEESDDDSASSEDDADPLKGFHARSAEDHAEDSSKGDRSNDDSDDDSNEGDGMSGGMSKNQNDPKEETKHESSSSSSSTSSSSSSDSSDSDSDSESESDADNNETHEKYSAERNRLETEENENDDDGSENDDDDDFFTTEKVSAEDIFAEAQRQQRTKKGRYSENNDAGEDLPFQKRKPDKSKGFATQKQRPGQYKKFQSRQKRMKFG